MDEQERGKHLVQLAREKDTLTAEYGRATSQRQTEIDDRLREIRCEADQLEP